MQVLISLWNSHLFAFIWARISNISNFKKGDKYQSTTKCREQKSRPTSDPTHLNHVYMSLPTCIQCRQMCPSHGNVYDSQFLCHEVWVVGTGWKRIHPGSYSQWLLAITVLVSVSHLKFCLRHWNVPGKFNAICQEEHDGLRRSEWVKHSSLYWVEIKIEKDTSLNIREFYLNEMTKWTHWRTLSQDLAWDLGQVKAPHRWETWRFMFLYFPSIFVFYYQLHA